MIDKNLYDAVNRGSAEEVTRLIQAGVDVNSRNNDGRTALHIAADGSFPECVEVLIMAGADVFAKDKTKIRVLTERGWHSEDAGETPIDLAKDNLNECKILHERLNECKILHERAERCIQLLEQAMNKRGK